MAFLSRLFSKNADDYLVKGDRLLEAERFFEARNAYQEGLEKYLAGAAQQSTGEIQGVFLEKIAIANRAMAEINLREAEHAFGRGDHTKALEHIELAKKLSDDEILQQNTEKMLANISENINDTTQLASTAAACASCSPKEPEAGFPTDSDEPNLSPQDHYDLLIRQLPGEMYNRYKLLDDKFILYYLAASRDDHAEALELLELWYFGSDSDIYRYEKGMIMCRLGNSSDAEVLFNSSIADNEANPLPCLGLALLLLDDGRFAEASLHLDGMLAKGILPEYSRMLRGDASLLSGNTEDAIEHYTLLLSTPFARQSAEKLHDILLHSNRKHEAEIVYKRYLGGCCH